MHRLQLYRLMITLTLFWLLFSGMFKPLLLILGLISIAIVCVLATNMQVLMHKGQPLAFRLLPFLRYCCWLIVEVLISNIQVIKRIVQPSLPINPILKAVPACQKTEVGKVIYANSITLTPGTVAI
ncbi:MAG: Na+/H+ antiporter subunit E, partial [Pseudomonadota bacterium]